MCCGKVFGHRVGFFLWQLDALLAVGEKSGLSWVFLGRRGQHPINHVNVKEIVLGFL